MLDINDPNLWVRCWIFEIDAAGNLLSEWRTEKEEKLGGCFVELSGENELTMISAKIQPNPPTVGTSLSLVMRKLRTSDWQTIWQTSQTAADCSYFGGWQNFRQNPVNGAWDVVGTYQHYQTGFIMSGITAQVNDHDGSTVWLRKDTVYVSPLLHINENHLSGIAHLSSGSIIAGGWVLSTEGGDLHQEAWLLKLSKDGCIEPGDCVTVPTKGPERANGPAFLHWQVFPNPAKDYTYLVPDMALQGKSAKVEIFDQKGTLAHMAVFEIQTQQALRVNLRDLPPGLYTYQVTSEGKRVGGGRVMVAWQ
jgi:hypothetical protein